MNRNWDILQINTKFYRVFQATQMIVLKRSKNLQQTIGGHTVKKGNVFKKSLLRQNGTSLPCSLTRPSLGCTQIVNTQTFILWWCLAQNLLRSQIPVTTVEFEARHHHSLKFDSKLKYLNKHLWVNKQEERLIYSTN